MEITIYQIDFDRDEHDVAFMGLRRLMRLQGSSQVDSAIYNKVYSGNVDCRDLEDVYLVFNERRPPDFEHRSLSVGDVVEVVNHDGCPELVGRIRFYNSATAYEEMSYLDEKQFLEEIQEAKFVGRCIEVDDLRGKHIPCIETGFYFCDDFGFSKIEFESEKALDVRIPEQINPERKKNLDDIIKGCQRGVFENECDNKQNAFSRDL